MNKVAAFALRRKNSILSMSEKMFCPPQPLRFWITPAYAGKRRSDWIIRSIYWDHPRVCGEKTKPVPAGGILMGSPPRMQGKVYFLQQGDFTIRITPACAGKRSQGFAVRLSTRDHPRMCGEKAFSWMWAMASRGSPPRMRGKDAFTHVVCCALGITPAYAGKRWQQTESPGFVKDHPRVCGEKFERSDPRFPSRGSPPRMRGKGNFHVVTHTKVGITPACAGKSTALQPPSHWFRDHPRVCGEKQSK